MKTDKPAVKRREGEKKKHENPVRNWACSFTVSEK